MRLTFASILTVSMVLTIPIKVLFVCLSRAPIRLCENMHAHEILLITLYCIVWMSKWGGGLLSRFSCSQIAKLLTKNQLSSGREKSFSDTWNLLAEIPETEFGTFFLFCYWAFPLPQIFLLKSVYLWPTVWTGCHSWFLLLSIV